MDPEQTQTQALMPCPALPDTYAQAEHGRMQCTSKGVLMVYMNRGPRGVNPVLWPYCTVSTG